MAKLRPKLMRRLKDRERRYPIWSARAVVLMFFIGLLIATPVALFVGPKGALHKIELVLGIFAIAMYAFLAFGLYRGARVKRQEDMVGKLSTLNPGDMPSNLDIGNLDFSGGDDLLGCVVGLFAGILLLILGIIAIIVFANVAMILFFVITATTGWIFHRALRQVFTRSRQCRGNLAASMMWAGWYTLMYTGWLAAALFALDWVMQRKIGQG